MCCVHAGAGRAHNRVAALAQTALCIFSEALVSTLASAAHMLCQVHDQCIMCYYIHEPIRTAVTLVTGLTSHCCGTTLSLTC
jgi:hypothetical protein